MRSSRAPFVLSLLAALALGATACGTAGHVVPPTTSGETPSTAGAATCTAIRGVATGLASIHGVRVPSRFHRTSGDPGDLASGAVTYSKETGRADPPRIEISLSHQSGPLTAAVGGRPSGTPLLVHGRHALLETGPPDPAFVGVYWKPVGDDVLSVVGYLVRAATVVGVARSLSFAPARVVVLPELPGRVVSRADARSIALHAVRGLALGTAAAKLTSWTEIAAVWKAAGGYTSSLGRSVPARLASSPWTPVWAVLVTAGAARSADLVVVAASGTVLLSDRLDGHLSWFPALTDRDPRLAGCRGGSKARPPFGVLTRDEESFTLRRLLQSGTRGYRVTVVERLTTVPTLNRADPGLYGGCTEQDCSLAELVWPTIEVIRPHPGSTLTCPPPWVSTPTGTHSRPTTQYFIVSVPNNEESGCGALPSWVTRLKDLAPPALS